MNADREVILEETLQLTLTQLKNHTWTDIEALSQNGSIPPEQVFEKAGQDLQHVKLINSMLATATKELSTERSVPHKCEDSVEFSRIAAYFQSNSERFLQESPTYVYDFETLVPELTRAIGKNVQFADGFLPVITIPVGDFFVVKIVFSIEHSPAFVVVHGASEAERSPFEQSDFRVFRTLAVYFSRTLPDFILKYRQRGLIEFTIWLRSYENLFTAPCAKCESIIARDLTGDLLPPIIRTVNSCYPYHVRCAPFEIELPDFGYVTLMSEEQMQEKVAHSGKQ